ncbi:olfactory receptor 2B8-like [Chelonoidis abingdonii]|uniref:olfactory receptor 2B8-like n=1 Tax=Chelonoidis abingdonii TaxID=106734 RepID=UPI003F492BB2
MTLFGNTTIIMISWLDPHLHAPMYFFLSNLSFLDLCYTTSIGPQMLLNFRSTHKSISWAGCVAQLYISPSLGCTECLLLAIMAYDRYAAICQPLCYTAIMSLRLCLQLAATAWLCSFGNSVLQTIRTMRLPRCGRNQIDNLFCEVPAPLKLACINTSANEAEVLASSVIFLLVPLGFILMSYGYIGATVLKIRSAKGRLKAFNTCASHLVVVLLFYGTGISMYLQPPSSYSQHRGKIVSLFYTMVTPMLNPLIYTLRNKEVHRTLQKVLGRSPATQGTQAGALKPGVHNITHWSRPLDLVAFLVWRDSSKVSWPWRHQLLFHQVQEMCKLAMEVFVYRPVTSEEEEERDIALPRKEIKA